MSFVTRLRDKTNRVLAATVRTRGVSMRNSRPIVSFTFDDFPKSAVSTGASLLEQRDVCGTFYCVSAFCGAFAEEQTCYDLEDLRRLNEAGHEIGCHTASHVRVSRSDRTQILREVDTNAKFIFDTLGDVRLTTFAYPFGDLNLGAKLLLQQRFAACRTTSPGHNCSVADLGGLKSQALDAKTTASSVARYIEDAVSENAWLIFFTHDVSDSPSAYGCTPEILKTAISQSIAAGCEVLTVRNALGKIGFGGEAPRRYGVQKRLADIICA